MMKEIRIHRKNPALTYTIFVIIGVLLAIIIVPGLVIALEAYILFMFVTLSSFISLVISINRANKEFRLITVDADYITFIFLNKQKKPLTIGRSKVKTEVKDDCIVFVRKDEGNMIGKVVKKRLKKDVSWAYLVEVLATE